VQNAKYNIIIFIIFRDFINYWHTFCEHNIDNGAVIIILLFITNHIIISLFIILYPARERVDSAHPPLLLSIETGSPMAGCCVEEPVLVGERRVLSMDRHQHEESI